jgi:hypothetical protein
LSKRIFGITSNCLFTAIVLVAALGVGRQILRWWKADAPASSDAKQNADFAAGLNDPARLHILQFGHQGWSLARREYRGSREAVEKQLRLECREQLEKIAEQRKGKAPAEPKESPSKLASPATRPDSRAAEIEQSFLASLAKTPPVDSQPPHWQLFAPDRNNRQMLVGVAPPLAKNSTDDATAHLSGSAGPQIVLWAIALPKERDTWSLLLFIPAADGDSGNPSPTDIPLPPKCRKMLSVQAVNGGAMVTFSGPGDSASWREHFDGAFAKLGWKTAILWQNNPSAWYAQYRGPLGGKPYRLDLHLFPQGKEEMSGMALIGPTE